jgi:hypothetical protein
VFCFPSEKLISANKVSKRKKKKFKEKEEKISRVLPPIFDTLRVPDFCCDEFVDDCGTTKPLSEQHVSMAVGKLKTS